MQHITAAQDACIAFFSSYWQLVETFNDSLSLQEIEGTADSLRAPSTSSPQQDDDNFDDDRRISTWTISEGKARLITTVAQQTDDIRFRQSIHQLVAALEQKLCEAKFITSAGTGAAERNLNGSNSSGSNSKLPAPPSHSPVASTSPRHAARQQPSLQTDLLSVVAPIGRRSSISVVVPSESPPKEACVSNGSITRIDEQHRAQYNPLLIPLHSTNSAQESFSSGTHDGSRRGGNTQQMSPSLVAVYPPELQSNSSFTSHTYVRGDLQHLLETSTSRAVTSNPSAEFYAELPCARVTTVQDLLVQAHSMLHEVQRRVSMSSSRSLRSQPHFHSRNPSITSAHQTLLVGALLSNVSSQDSGEAIQLRRQSPSSPSTAGSLHLVVESNSDMSLLSLHQPPHQITTTTTATRQRDDVGMKLLNDYILLDTIGRGAAGKVKLAFSPIHNRLVAVKIVRRSLATFPVISPLAAHDDDDQFEASCFMVSHRFGAANSLGLRRAQEEQEKSAQREIAVMKKLRHKNIVSLYEVIDDPEAAKLYLVMQYVDRGCIGSVRDDGTCERIPSEKLLDIARQAAAGLEYLHSHGVLHHDIKPENILIDSDERVYIGDFGVSAVATAHHQSGEGGGTAGDKARRFSTFLATTAAATLGGTPLFMPPETFCPRDASEAASPHGLRYPHAWDVWSFGVTFFCLLVGELPLHSLESIRSLLIMDPSTEEVELANFHDSLSDRISKLALDDERFWTSLLLRCLDPSPAERPPAATLKKVIKQQLSQRKPQRVLIPEDPEMSNAIASGFLGDPRSARRPSRSHTRVPSIAQQSQNLDNNSCSNMGASNLTVLEFPFPPQDHKATARHSLSSCVHGPAEPNQRSRRVSFVSGFLLNPDVELTPQEVAEAVTALKCEPSVM